jgi:5,10-methylene-tetrahydrofolate dehydrogenase/methenyl tetrahydrofolate cyclohydrolase
MTATIIDGSVVAERIRGEVAADAERFQEKFGFPPGLGFVLVGDDPASAQYVRMKRRAGERLGIAVKGTVLPASSTQAEVEAAVAAHNADPEIHGILIQLPLPDQIDEEAVLREVSLEKDADGLHPLNIGALAMKGREPTFTPATPTGCMALLDEVGVEVAGARAVVLGRSNIVGLPVALMLLKANATVTIAHSRTQNIPELLREADIVIAALGKPGFVQADWLKPGAVVIDVGTNKIDDPSTERGYRFVGDVDFEAAKAVVGAISKVPGGVGPMTITMLLRNTVKAAWRQAERTPV